MTDYTPEQVAELVSEARNFRHQTQTPIESVNPNSMLGLWLRTADALEAVAKERDEAEANHHRVVRLNNDLVDSKMLLAEERDKAIATGERILADALKVSAERDRLHRAITEALAGLELSAEPDWPGWNVLTGTENILRAALDKEGRA